MKIQIIMPAINLWNKYTRDAIESVNVAMVSAKAHNIDCRFLFIDNASTDETRDEAGKLVSDLFSHQRNEERWGFQKSVNFGVKDGFMRGFDIVLVCNNDITLHPEALWRLTERFSKGDVHMVSCMDVRGEMAEKNIAPNEIGRLIARDKETCDEAPHPNFSAFAVDRECWEVVGEFDELFAPAYFEDNDYHYRMKLAEIEAIVYPLALFYHYGSRTQNEAQEDGRPIMPSPMFENNRASYVRKWGGVPGQEQWAHPFNNPAIGLDVVKQTESLSTI